MRLRTLVLSIALAACACSTTDTGVGLTGSRDYTLTVSVKGRFIQVGDAIPVSIQLRRTDNSNLPSGLKGNILLTATANAEVDRGTLPVNVAGAATPDVSDIITFTGKRAGSAEVRATFQDATASVEIVISGVAP
ncbi:MAG: hypothetical protein EXS64_10795 [Candidatus Latescibacteria bacterium]|nr:hypothetical protein [Candidatus Latescibacterota bacterium]